MPKYKVTFEPSGLTVEVDPAQYPLGEHGRPGSLLDIAEAHGVTIEAACGGVGGCGTCHVIIRQGQQNLSEPQDAELDVVELVPGNIPDSRLACQAVVQGDVVVEVPAWNRNLVGEKHEKE